MPHPASHLTLNQLLPGPRLPVEMGQPHGYPTPGLLWYRPAVKVELPLGASRNAPVFSYLALTDLLPCTGLKVELPPNQVPLVSVEVLKYRYPAIGFVNGFANNLNLVVNQVGVIPLEVVGA